MHLFGAERARREGGAVAEPGTARGLSSG